MQRYILYSLCDYAPVFANHLSNEAKLQHIEPEIIEATLVTYLNFCAEETNIPLNFYRSDLHETGSILSGQYQIITRKYSAELKKLTKDFTSQDYVSYINNRYDTYTQLTKNVSLRKTDATNIINAFLNNYKQYAEKKSANSVTVNCSKK